MEMEWMESVIPVVDRQLDIRPVRIRDGVGLMTVYSRVERVVAHGEGGKEGWGLGFSICPYRQLCHCAPNDG